METNNKGSTIEFIQSEGTEIIIPSNANDTNMINDNPLFTVSFRILDTLYYELFLWWNSLFIPSTAHLKLQ